MEQGANKPQESKDDSNPNTPRKAARQRGDGGDDRTKRASLKKTFSLRRRSRTAKGMTATESVIVRNPYKEKLETLATGGDGGGGVQSSSSASLPDIPKLRLDRGTTSPLENDAKVQTSRGPLRVATDGDNRGNRDNTIKDEGRSAKGHKSLQRSMSDSDLADMGKEAKEHQEKPAASVPRQLPQQQQQGPHKKHQTVPSAKDKKSISMREKKLKMRLSRRGRDAEEVGKEEKTREKERGKGKNTSPRDDKEARKEKKRINYQKDANSRDRWMDGTTTSEAVKDVVN